MIVGDRRKGRVAAVARGLEPALSQFFDVVGIDLDHKTDLRRAKADLILVLGGDGSILRAARRLAHNSIPLMGINFGNLGFLATLPADDSPERIAELILDGWTIEARSQLLAECELAGTSKTIMIGEALNDVVIDRGLGARLLTLGLRIDGRQAFETRGDGIVISTPTGSTAYALAAGGPILHPTLDVMLLTPICPHSLTNRPIVVPGSSQIELEMLDADGAARLSLDGQTPSKLDLRTGSRVRLRHSEYKIQLAVIPNDSFYTRLRNKLHFARPAEG